jgi:tRNA-dihydrouridine synthase B
MSLKIGDVAIDFPVGLGALAGYSDLPYRLICRSLGAPYGITEAMLDRQVLLEGKLRKRLVRLDAADRPVAGQIMGIEPETMAEAARALDRMGFDIVDLNFACPVKKVVSHKRGGALMKDPERALATVRAVVEAVPGRPVTLKMRRAYREDDASRAAFWTIARGAFEAGAAAIAVHARTVEQKYTGRADWGFLAEVKRAFPDKVILGSGDVASPAEALRMLTETGVDGVLAARGAIGNPWFFAQARDGASRCFATSACSTPRCTPAGPSFATPWSRCARRRSGGRSSTHSTNRGTVTSNCPLSTHLRMNRDPVGRGKRGSRGIVGASMKR